MANGDAPRWNQIAIWLLTGFAVVLMAFGGANATQRANGIASWGLRLSLAAAVASAKRRLGLLMGVY
jgi:hypothetical protein